MRTFGRTSRGRINRSPCAADLRYLDDVNDELRLGYWERQGRDIRYGAVRCAIDGEGENKASPYEIYEIKRRWEVNFI